MSSGIAAPIGGRFLRARTLGHESAREHERKRLRRHLRVTALHTLESITGFAPDTDPAELIAVAGDLATDLRTFTAELADAKGGTAVAELQRQVGGTLHDTTLQCVEYLACDGYGAELDTATIRKVAGDAAVELRGTLLRLGAPEPCELITALEQVVSAAQRRGTVEVRLITDLNGSVYGAEAAALVGAVRDAGDQRAHRRQRRRRRRRPRPRGRRPRPAPQHHRAHGEHRRPRDPRERARPRYVRDAHDGHERGGGSMKIRVLVAEDHPLVREGVIRA